MKKTEKIPAVIMLALESASVICGAIFWILLILKLLRKTNWSWWSVTAPLWLNFIMLIAMFIITHKIRKG